MDDVLVAVAALALPALIVELLAEGEGDTPPAPVGVVSRGTLLHARAPVLEVAAGHARAGRVGLQAASQALVVAALVVQGAGAVLAGGRARSEERRVGKESSPV